MKYLHSTLGQEKYRLYLEDLLLEAHLWLHGIKKYDTDFEETFISILFGPKQLSEAEKENALDIFDQLAACNHCFFPKLYRLVSQIISDLEELLELPTISKPLFDEAFRQLNKQMYVINWLLVNWAQETYGLITKLKDNRDFRLVFDLFSMN